jgi:hypothetical protein
MAVDAQLIIAQSGGVRAGARRLRRQRKLMANLVCAADPFAFPIVGVEQARFESRDGALQAGPVAAIPLAALRPVAANHDLIRGLPFAARSVRQEPREARLRDLNPYRGR